MADTTVQVPRGLLMGVGLVLVGSLMGVAFLLGRQSGPPPTAVAPPPAPPATVAVAPSPSPAAPSPADPEGPDAATTAEPASPATGVPSAAPLRPKRKIMPASAPVSKAVAAYFKAVDAIAPGQLTDDPDKFANQIVQGAMNGDSSGMDKLIKEAQSGKTRLSALKAPAPCSDYQQQSLHLCDESIHVLKLMETALRTNDANALTSMASDAQAMQAKAQSLKDEEADLKSQYSVP